MVGLGTKSGFAEATMKIKTPYKPNLKQTKKTMADKKIPSWDELLASLNSAIQHPNDTGWDIYRYLSAHYKEMSSVEARTLLAGYMKLPLTKPSLLHSCILSVALKMSELFPDFNLLRFLVLWGFDVNLRAEDRIQQTSNDGKTYISLEDKAERGVRKYLTDHPADCPMQAVKELPMISQPVIGYVNSYDANNDYFHIFDNLSRHFVAISPKVTPDIGEFVWFTPIIPRNSTFKSAVIIRQEEHQRGSELFGLTDAEVTFVNTKDRYFGYKLLRQPPSTTEGSYTPEGTAATKVISKTGGKTSSRAPLKKGQHVKLLIFLTRGKDGNKHNHVAEAIVQ